MAIIKTLDFLLRGRTDQLGKDLARSRSMLSGFAGQVRSIVAGAIPVISVAGLTAGIRSALTELDGLRDRSIRLGIDSGELASLEQASQLAGLGINQLSTAQKVLSVQLSKANEGGLEQSKVFKKLRLSASEISKASPTQQLIKIGKALDTVTDRAEKTRIAVALFGKAGLSVIPLIANGAEDLKRSFAETSRLGGIFPDSALEQVAELNDNFDKLKFASGNAFKALAIELAPALIDITNLLINLIKPGEFVRDVFAEIGEAASLMTRDLRQSIAIFDGLLEKFNAISFGLGDALGDKVKFVLSGGLNPTVLSLQLKNMVAGWLGFNDEVEAVIPKLKKAKAEMAGLQTASQVNLNLGSAQAGSVAAFETVYGVKLQAPINQLIQATQEGNGILGDILDKIGEGEGNAVDEAEILGDLN